jgi:hypothetical protein
MRAEISLPEWNPLKVSEFLKFFEAHHFIVLAWRGDRVMVCFQQVTSDKVARAGAHLTNMAKEDAQRLQDAILADSSLSPGEWMRVASEVLEKGRHHYYEPGEDPGHG